jgi:hypothetical protein
VAEDHAGGAMAAGSSREHEAHRDATVVRDAVATGQ